MLLLLLLLSDFFVFRLPKFQIRATDTVNENVREPLNPSVCSDIITNDSHAIINIIFKFSKRHLSAGWTRSYEHEHTHAKKCPPSRWRTRRNNWLSHHGCSNRCYCNSSWLEYSLSDTIPISRFTISPSTRLISCRRQFQRKRQEKPRTNIESSWKHIKSIQNIESVTTKMMHIFWNLSRLK